MNVLECRKDCVREMGDFRNDQREDFFGSFFHYLQQGYHHSESVFVQLGGGLGKWVW